MMVVNHDIRRKCDTILEVVGTTYRLQTRRSLPFLLRYINYSSTGLNIAYLIERSTVVEGITNINRKEKYAAQLRKSKSLHKSTG